MFKKHPENPRCFSLMLPSLPSASRVFGYLNTKPKTVHLEHDVGLSSDNVMQQNHDTPEVSWGRPEKLPGSICSTNIITYPLRNSRPYDQGLLTIWFPLIRPKIKPLFLRGGTWPGV